jgi:putative membrane protein
VCAFISRGFYVFTYRPYCFDPAYHLPFLPVSRRPVGRSRRSPSLLLVLFLWHFGLYGCIQRAHVEAAAESPPDEVTEQDFLTTAAAADLAALDMARVGKMHSKNGAVKSYAGMILKDRQQSLQDLTRLMREKNVTQPDTFDDETKQDIDRMATLSGSEFDREFINMMVAHQEKTLELFRGVSLTAHDTAVQDYVDGMIPILDKHLRKAQELQSKLFSGRATPK